VRAFAVVSGDHFNFLEDALSVVPIIDGWSIPTGKVLGIAYSVMWLDDEKYVLY